MPEMSRNCAEAPADGASCTVRSGGQDASRRSGTGGLLSGGCCAEESGGLMESQVPMSPAARRTRALVGMGFLVVAGALGTRRLPGRIALWPASLVPTWFGISHLIAGVTGYQGCPEIGAIPSVMLGRPVGSSCELWQRIDAWVQPTHLTATPCC
jgi:hypothetical protein